MLLVAIHTADIGKIADGVPLEVHGRVTPVRQVDEGGVAYLSWADNMGRETRVRVLAVELGDQLVTYTCERPDDSDEGLTLFCPPQIPGW